MSNNKLLSFFISTIVFVGLLGAEEKSALTKELNTKGSKILMLLDKYNFTFRQHSGDDPRRKIFEITQDEIRLLDKEYRKILSGICLSHAFGDTLFNLPVEAIDCYVRLMNVDSDFSKNNRIKILNLILEDISGPNYDTKIVLEGETYKMITQDLTKKAK